MDVLVAFVPIDGGKLPLSGDPELSALHRVHARPAECLIEVVVPHLQLPRRVEFSERVQALMITDLMTRWPGAHAPIDPERIHIISYLW